MNIIIFILICFGLTNILVYSKILSSIRPNDGFWGDMLHCPMCTGFWVGLFIAIVSNISNILVFNLTLVDYVFLSCLSSGTSYILAMLVDDDGFKIEFFF